MKNICSLCVSDDTFPNITFDKDNICSECLKFNEFEKKFPVGEKGEKIIKE